MISKFDVLLSLAFALIGGALYFFLKLAGMDAGMSFITAVVASVLMFIVTLYVMGSTDAH